MTVLRDLHVCSQRPIGTQFWTQTRRNDKGLAAPGGIIGAREPLKTRTHSYARLLLVTGAVELQNRGLGVRVPPLLPGRPPLKAWRGKRTLVAA